MKWNLNKDFVISIQTSIFRSNLINRSDTWHSAQKHRAIEMSSLSNLFPLCIFYSRFLNQKSNICGLPQIFEVHALNSKTLKLRAKAKKLSLRVSQSNTKRLLNMFQQLIDNNFSLFWTTYSIEHKTVSIHLNDAIWLEVWKTNNSNSNWVQLYQNLLSARILIAFKLSGNVSEMGIWMVFDFESWISLSYTFYCCLFSLYEQNMLATCEIW